ncbi:MAG: RNA polymerase sigma factor [Pyrinomonadaceae bacterium]
MDSSGLRSQLEKYQRESFGWALSCCRRDPSEAESVLQAVYLKVLEGKARFDGKAAFKTWLFAVIRQTAADARRRKFLRRLKLSKYTERAGYTAQAESLDETIYRSEVQLLFRQALAALPQRQREVLQLVFYHDLSLSEAAAVMGVSVGSARTHYERGKKRLRRLMTKARVCNESESGRARDQAAIPRVEAGG